MSGWGRQSSVHRGLVGFAVIDTWAQMSNNFILKRRHVLGQVALGEGE